MKDGKLASPSTSLVRRAFEPAAVELRFQRAQAREGSGTFQHADIRLEAKSLEVLCSVNGFMRCLYPPLPERSNVVQLASMQLSMP